MITLKGFLISQSTADKNRAHFYYIKTTIIGNKSFCSNFLLQYISIFPEDEIDFRPQKLTLKIGIAHLLIATSKLSYKISKTL